MQKKTTASTYEKQLEKIQSEIELMEKANVEPKDWTMQGEVISHSPIFVPVFFIGCICRTFLLISY
jgi:hypothetical protein